MAFGKLGALGAKGGFGSLGGLGGASGSGTPTLPARLGVGTLNAAEDLAFSGFNGLPVSIVDAFAYPSASSPTWANILGWMDTEALRGANYDICWGFGIPRDKTLSDIVAGTETANITAVFNKMLTARPGTSDIYVRMLPEPQLNSDGKTWSVIDNTDAVYKAASIIIVGIGRGISARFKFIFNPNYNTKIAGIDKNPLDFYAGDSYFDGWGLDLYKISVFDGNGLTAWNTRLSETYGVTWFLGQVTSRPSMFSCFPEIGVDNNADAPFIQQFKLVVANPVNKVKFFCYFDVNNDINHQNKISGYQYPAVSDAFIAAFGLLAPGSAASFDFQNALYTGGSLASMLSVTQAATTYAWNSAGSMVAFAPNVPRITDRGLLREPAATNLQLGSNSLSDSTNYWTPTNSTVTTGAADPLGGTSAFTLNEGAAAAVGHFINTKTTAAQSVTTGNYYCVSAVVKAGTNTKLQLAMGGTSFTGFGAGNFNLSGDGNATIVNILTVASSGMEPLGNGWFLCWMVQQATASSATGGGGLLAHLNSMTAIRVAAYTGSSRTIVAHYVQFEQVANANSRPSSFTPATTATVTRAADVVTLQGAAAAALASASGSILIGTAYGQGGTAETLIDSNGTALLSKSSANLLTTALSTPISSANSALWLLQSKAFLSWSPSGRNLILNNNVAVTDATAVTPAAPFTISGMGYITKLGIWTSVVANSLAGLPFQGPLTAWGDSLTANTLNFGSTLSWPIALSSRNYLGSANARTVSNQGVSGETSTQIKTRFNAGSARWNTGTVLWAGRNNYAAPTTVKSDIAAMVASLLTPSYVVVGVTTSANGSENAGSANAIAIGTLNSDLATVYGSKFLDILPVLVAAYNPAHPIDIINNAAGVIPFTLRSNYSNGAVSGATINPGDTTFNVTTTNSNLAVGDVLTIGTEYILILGVSVGAVSSCTRGYAGTTPGTYVVGTTYLRNDPLHIGDAGNKIVADQVNAKIAALGSF